MNTYKNGKYTQVMKWSMETMFVVIMIVNNIIETTPGIQVAGVEVLPPLVASRGTPTQCTSDCRKDCQ